MSTTIQNNQESGEKPISINNEYDRSPSNMDTVVKIYKKNNLNNTYDTVNNNTKTPVISKLHKDRYNFSKSNTPEEDTYKPNKHLRNNFSLSNEINNNNSVKYSATNKERLDLALNNFTSEQGVLESCVYFICQEEGVDYKQMTNESEPWTPKQWFTVADSMIPHYLNDYSHINAICEVLYKIDLPDQFILLNKIGNEHLAKKIIYRLICKKLDIKDTGHYAQLFFNKSFLNGDGDSCVFWIDEIINKEMRKESTFLLDDMFKNENIQSTNDIYDISLKRIDRLVDFYFSIEVHLNNMKISESKKQKKILEEELLSNCNDVFQKSSIAPIEKSINSISFRTLKIRSKQIDPLFYLPHLRKTPTNIVEKNLKRKLLKLQIAAIKQQNKNANTLYSNNNNEPTYEKTITNSIEIQTDAVNNNPKVENIITPKNSANSLPRKIISSNNPVRFPSFFDPLASSNPETIYFPPYQVNMDDKIVTDKKELEKNLETLINKIGGTKKPFLYYEKESRDTLFGKADGLISTIPDTKQRDIYYEKVVNISNISTKRRKIFIGLISDQTTKERLTKKYIVTKPWFPNLKWMFNWKWSLPRIFSNTASA